MAPHTFSQAWEARRVERLELEVLEWRRSSESWEAAYHRACAAREAARDTAARLEAECAACPAPHHALEEGTDA